MITPLLTHILVREFLAKNNTMMLPHRPYFPDLIPVTFFVLETEEAKIEDEPKHVQAKSLSKINRTFKMAELVGISEGYEYQHDATKNRKSNKCNPRKFEIRDAF